MAANRCHVTQPSPAAGSSTVPVRATEAGSGTPPQPAGEDACVTSTVDPENHLVAGFHSRGALPHLKREGGTYFVTFRQAGTLPRDVLLAFKAERESALHHALAAKRPLTWHEQEELFRWYSDRVDRYLDCGHSACHLRRPACAEVVVGALKFFDGQRYQLQAWVIMPNHVHVVVWPAPPHTLSEILHGWKSFTAHEINKLLTEKAVPFWQSESYDHLIRDDDDLHRCSNYVWMNPVNAGLCAEAHLWPWSSARVAQPSPAAGSGTVPVRVTETGGGTPPQPAGGDACATKQQRST
jgi:REP element-mobilizing transposase RayT